MRWIRLSFHGLVIGAAIGEIVSLGLGGTMSRADMFVWPALVIGWWLITLMKDATLRLTRKTIDFQRITIRNQADLIGQILATYNDGRE